MEISVNTSNLSDDNNNNSIITLNQQDSGSNQSGSDSGLGGHTNSISSDNSSSLLGNNNATRTVKANIDSGGGRDSCCSAINSNQSNNKQQLGESANNKSGIECYPIYCDVQTTTKTPNSDAVSSTTNAAIIGDGTVGKATSRNNNNAISDKKSIMKVGHHRQESQQKHTNQVTTIPLSPKCTQKEVSSNINSNEPKAQEKLITCNLAKSSKETDAILYDVNICAAKADYFPIGKLPSPIISSPASLSDHGDYDHRGSGGSSTAAENDDCGTRGSDGVNLDGCSLEPKLSSPSLPNLKSSLKKVPKDKDGSPSGPVKHNRNVSFNQTVIVFCEEIELTPALYQDSSHESKLCEPPKDFCDLGPTSDLHAKEVAPLDKDNLDFFSKIVANNASNLTDDQLFGLLENESSLIESFKLNCDDLSDDEEFTNDQLNSHQAYLNHDAITDSESESPIHVNREKRCPVSNSPEPYKTTLLVDQKMDVKRHSSITRNRSLSAVSNEKSSSTGTTESGVSPLQIDASQIVRNKVNQQPQRAMPARMKVTAVGNKKQLQHQQPSQQIPTSGLDSRGTIKMNSDSLSLQTSSCASLQSTNDIPVFMENSARPMIVKQTNIAPAATSRPTIFKSNHVTPSSQLASKLTDPQKFGTNSTPISVPRQSETTSSNQQKSIASHLSERQTNNAIINTNIRPQANQSQPACHICRAIETNRGHASAQNSAGDNLPGITTTSNNHTQQLGQATPPQLSQQRSIIVQSQRPVVLNPSCASCREASTVQLNADLKAPQQLPQNLVSHSQTGAPVAYQVVYVVDQKGNRVRALQVVGPTFISPNLVAGQPGRQFFIAQNGNRFSNPMLLSGQQGIRLLVPGPSAISTLPSGAISSGVQQFQTRPPIPRENNQLVAAQNMPVNIQIGQRAPGIVQIQPNHTVYYIRKPLAAQSIRQSLDSTDSGVRTFPDPHEIRRMDGLRGIASAGSMRGDGQTYKPFPNSGGQQDVNINKQAHVPKRDDYDDPTFGFSSRPSVKVVSTNVSKSEQNMGPKTSNFNGALDKSSNIAQTSAHNHVTEPPMSSKTVAMGGTQTLNRRISNRNQQSQTLFKENMPSTNSMSNINATLRSYPDSISVNISRQHQRNSENQNSDFTESSSSKVLNEQNRKRIYGVINDDQSTNYGRQPLTSQEYRGNPSPTNQARRVAQDKAEIVYTMNI